MISLADLKRRIDKGEISPDAALAQQVAAIEAQEKAIGAFAFRADKLQAQQEGPLRGIAIGIKDIIDTADLPTEMGAAIYKGHRPRADAPIVMLL
jgi:Asp-tRNA(Asn)/Glu-tRNA(Gln) amidotransferase A subunit family amidase